MRYSRALIPTLKEAPTEAASPSHALLLRAGYVRRAAGSELTLPLGLRVLEKLAGLVRGELEASGALELRLPAALPSDGPSRLDLVCELARRELHSYRDLPKQLYQIQVVYDDERAARGGLTRSREHYEYDAYSLDTTEARARESYAAMRGAFQRILELLGLEYRIAADGSEREEIQVPLPLGEDTLAACLQCPYAASIDVATSPPYPRRGPAASELLPRELVHTPGHGSIAAVAGLLKQPVTSFLKSLVYKTDQGGLVLAVVRGDHEVNEAKLALTLGAESVELASRAEVESATGASLGFAGPVGFGGAVVVDRDAASVADGVTGANQTDYHLLHVTHGRDFQGSVADIRRVVDGDLCPECGASLKLCRSVGVGHIMLLASGAASPSYVDEQGQQRPLALGSYGLDLSLVLAALVEQLHDKDGLVWPLAIAPFQVHLVQIGVEPEVASTVAQLERELERRGLEVLVDDREERPGVKFKDADLLGVPLRVTVGQKALEAGGVELKKRSDRDPKHAQILPLDAAAEMISELVEQALRAPATSASA